MRKYFQLEPTNLNHKPALLSTPTMSNIKIIQVKILKMGRRNPAMDSIEFSAFYRHFCPK
jgi:hypothetical protein